MEQKGMLRKAKIEVVKVNRVRGGAFGASYSVVTFKDMEAFVLLTAIVFDEAGHIAVLKGTEPYKKASSWQYELAIREYLETMEDQ